MVLKTYFLDGKNVSAQDWSISSVSSLNIRVMKPENLIEAYYGKKDFSHQKVVEEYLIYSFEVSLYQLLRI